MVSRHKVGRERRGYALVAAGRAEGFQKAFFTSSFAKAMEDREGREGNEETGVGSYQISKQTLFLPCHA
jgi:hypothetical protein